MKGSQGPCPNRDPWTMLGELVSKPSKFKQLTNSLGPNILFQGGGIWVRCLLLALGVPRHLLMWQVVYLATFVGRESLKRGLAELRFRRG